MGAALGFDAEFGDEAFGAIALAEDPCGVEAGAREIGVSGEEFLGASAVGEGSVNEG